MSGASGGGGGSSFSLAQLRVMLWKNWLLKKRAPWSSLAELVLPMLFMLILCSLRGVATVTTEPDTLYTNLNASDLGLNPGAGKGGQVDVVLNATGVTAPLPFDLNIIRTACQDECKQLQACKDACADLFPGSEANVGGSVLAAFSRCAWDDLFCEDKDAAYVSTAEAKAKAEKQAEAKATAAGMPPEEARAAGAAAAAALSLSNMRFRATDAVNPALRDMLLAAYAFNASISVLPSSSSASYASYAKVRGRLVAVRDALVAEIIADAAATNVANLTLTADLPYVGVPQYVIDRLNAAKGTATTGADWAPLNASLYSLFAFDGEAASAPLASFDSEAALDARVGGAGYDASGAMKVGAAIVFEQGGGGDAFRYSLRLNYTNPAVRQGSSNPFAPKTTPAACFTRSGCGRTAVVSTKESLNTISKSIDADCEERLERGICAQLSYAQSGFLTLQRLVDEAILGELTPPLPTSAVASTLMPVAAYRTDNFQNVIKNVLALFYMLSFLYPVSRLIRAVVLEKERRIKEGMRMMGLTDGTFYAAWFLSTLAQFTAMSVLLTLVAANGSSNAVFLYSSKFLVWFYFWSFSLSVIGLCFLISVFFSKSKTAATLGTLVFFGAFIPYNAISDPAFAAGTKKMASLLSPTAFALGTGVFADFEGGTIGVTAANAGTVTGNYSYNTCVSMMLFDFFLYMALAWWLDRVLPSEFGTQRPACFCCPCRCFGCGGKAEQEQQRRQQGAAAPRPVRGEQGSAAESMLSDTQAAHLDIETGMLHLKTATQDGLDEDSCEAVPPELRQQEEHGAHRCLQTFGLRRVFKTTDGADRVAVKGLGLTMYHGQITALLGHNGAGKSTTINMLTGLLPPTAGDALVCGRQLTTRMEEIRKSMGVCPQHDILFDELTVLEHLQLFAIFKGVPRADADAVAARFIGEVGLTEKASVQSRALSGGMKRKLSVAIALIGEATRVVVLDEPTSGMDPYSRRSTWSLLQAAKRDKVVLLTTHFMDEADILGDRIAIMAAGQLRCVGSSLFLKNRYGVGYTLTLVRQGEAAGADGSTKNASEKQRVAALSDIVASHVGAGAEPLSDVGGELSFRLPLEAVGTFAPLFRRFDEAIAAGGGGLGLNSYGISVTTLEEVFMRVGHGTDDEQTRAQLETMRQSSSQRASSLDGGGAVAEAEAVVGGSPELEAVGATDKALFNRGSDGQLMRSAFYSASAGRTQQRKIFARHFWALFLKRLINAKRDRKLVCFQLVIPAVFVVFGLALLKVSPSDAMPALVLDATAFNEKFPAADRNHVPFNATTPAGRANATALTKSGRATDTAYPSYAVADIVNSTFYIDEPTTPNCSLPQSDAMSAYLLHTYKDYGWTRYGAILWPGTDDGSPAPAPNGAAQCGFARGGYKYEVMTNASAMHGVPMYINAATTARAVAAGKGSVVVGSHPLPQTAQQKKQKAGVAALFASFNIVIAFSFIPASYAIFIVKEREIKAKHQQLISGVSLLAFWCSTFAFDAVSYLIPCAFTILAILAFGVEAYATGAGLQGTVMLFLLYGPAVAGFTYMISFGFKSHSTAQNLVLFLNFLTGLILSTVSYILSNLESTRDLNSKYLKNIYRLFPSFNLADGLQTLAFCDGDTCLTYQNGKVLYKKPWDWDVAGANITFLAVETVVYFGITMAIEWALTFPSFTAMLGRDPSVSSKAGGGAALVPADEDTDVGVERARIEGGGGDDDVIRLEGIRKVYPGAAGNGLCSRPGAPKVAVRSLSFGIPRGECFGFLGINGAGKTTTLSMLSGEFPPSGGEASIAGFSIKGEQSAIRREIGYCPQFDALFELLTPREHLELYARIKGVEEAALGAVVGDKLRQLDLLDFADKNAGSLSGGNKRKLSVAIAMIGEPTIVFLDEPSTGMDPVARRFMWDVIAQLSTREGRCSIMLTTHSMEEAEALCTRIGIMVNGGLQCLGSAQHLKNRFGSGYELDLKAAVPSQDELAALAARAGVAADGVVAEERVPALLEAVAWGGATGTAAALRAELAAAGSGHDIAAALAADGEVRAASLFGWVLAEQRSAGIDAFLTGTFPGAALVEKASAQSMRYKVPAAGSITLAVLFENIEGAKGRLGISEYSVGQTTLEQIFNQFAGSQLNPENKD